MNLIRSAVKKHKPPHTRGQVFPKILSCQQISAPSPTFTITLPPNATLPQHYLGYLTNELRKKYNFFGTPIKIIITTT
jgi:GTP-binding protein